MFSRGVERSETPGNKCKIRCFRRNHLVARMMIPCRETIWGRARGPGVSLRSTTRLSLDFSLREKSSSLSARSCKGARVARAGAGELPLNVTNEPKDFALKGQDGGNRGQHRRCARGERCPTIKRNPETGCISMC